MTQLIKYEAACRAIAECKAVDEVKGLVDKAAAMQAYGRMAKDRTLEVDAAEIRIRAERRLGEMLSATKADGGLNKDANLRRGPEVVSNDLGKAAPTLADAGISKDLSSRAQKLAAVPEADFEAELAAKRERDKQDGARVSARLERAGEQALKKKAAEPEDYGPSAEEIAEAEQSVRDNETTMRLILESDDKLAAVTTELARVNALNRSLNLRITGLTNEKAELIRMIKSLRRQAEKAAA